MQIALTVKFFSVPKGAINTELKGFFSFLEKNLKKVFDDVIVESGKCAAEKSSTIQV